MRFNNTTLKAALKAYVVCLEEGLTKQQAMAVAAGVCLLNTKLTDEARRHPDNIKAARVEVLRAGIITGIIAIGVVEPIKED